MSAWQEFCEWRKIVGLPLVKQSFDMTMFAEQKSRWQAERGHDGGHEGPKVPDSTWREGTAKAAPMWGWLTCIQEEDAEIGGAGMCIGTDGERHMCLILSGGSGKALIPRNNIPIYDTSHLTPNPPSVNDPPMFYDQH